MAETRFRRFRPVANRYLNPINRRVLVWLPGFGTIIYRGRKTGREYELPINVFRSDGDYLFFLTYGSPTQWVRNVLAAGGCDFRRWRRTVRLVDPQLIDDPELSPAPFVARRFLRWGRVRQYLRLRPAPS